MNEAEIQDFWQAHPCGDLQVGGFREFAGNYEKFFSEYDTFRYQHEGHILRCLDRIDFAGKQVLEIGLGQGADAEQIIRRGGLWSGLDLTQESVDRVSTRLSLRQLPHQAIKRGTVLEIPYKDDTFDIVFSHGVLHHVPDIVGAQKEIHRVLRPEGELIVMLYARWSLNYLLSISLLRRLGLWALHALRFRPGGIYDEHLDNAEREGLGKYLRMDNFIHRNTDGPFNPFSRVYDVKKVREDFPQFNVVAAYKRFMHAPPLPVGRLPLGALLGWHLWVHLKPAPVPVNAFVKSRQRERTL